MTTLKLSYISYFQEKQFVNSKDIEQRRAYILNTYIYRERFEGKIESHSTSIYKQVHII
jgi:hypothetical protein